MIKHVINEARENPGSFGLALVGAARGVHETVIKPTVSENPAVVAWMTCLAVPGIYDAWAAMTKHETMSHAFHRAWENPNPMYRFMCAGLAGALAVHLCHGVKDPAPSASPDIGPA